MCTLMCDDNKENNLLEYFQRFCNPKFEKWKNTKKWPRSHARQEKLGDLFLVFPTRLET